MKKTFRLDEIAEELKVSRRTVERWVEKGHLPAFRIGHTTRTRIDLEELEAQNRKGKPRP